MLGGAFSSPRRARADGTDRINGHPPARRGRRLMSFASAAKHAGATPDQSAGAKALLHVAVTEALALMNAGETAKARPPARSAGARRDERCRRS